MNTIKIQISTFGRQKHHCIYICGTFLKFKTKSKAKKYLALLKKTFKKSIEYLNNIYSNVIFIFRQHYLSFSFKKSSLLRSQLSLFESTFDRIFMPVSSNSAFRNLSTAYAQLIDFCNNLLQFSKSLKRINLTNQINFNLSLLESEKSSLHSTWININGYDK